MAFLQSSSSCPRTKVRRSTSMDVEKRGEERRTESGIEVKPLYKPEDLEGFD